MICQVPEPHLSPWWRREPGKLPWIVAHRGGADWGGAGMAPENTRQAFAQAARWALSHPRLLAAELDLQATSDGVPVVFHDDTLDRLTSTCGAVEEFSWTRLHAEVRGADGMPLPLLEDVFPLLEPSSLRLFVEIKNPAITSATLAALRQSAWAARCVVGSFHLQVVRDLIDMARDEGARGDASWATLWLLPADKEAEPQKYRGALDELPSVIGLSLQQATAAVVQGWRHLGCAVWVYTVNDPEDARRLADAGVDALISDFPVRLEESV